MFRGLKVYHQDVSCNKIGNTVECMSTYVVYGESSVCGYIWITVKVIVGRAKVHVKSVYKSFYSKSSVSTPYTTYADTHYTMILILLQINS